MAYLSAASLVPGRVEVQQVGYAQETVVTPTKITAHRRHWVQRAGRADRVSAHQRWVRAVLVTTAAVERCPLHFGDEQRLHERARSVVQAVQWPELGLMTAEDVAAAANTAGCWPAVAPAVAVTVAAVTANVAFVDVIVASVTIIVVVAAADGWRVAAAVVTASICHRATAIAAAPVQVAERRGRAPAQVAGHPSAFLRLPRRRRHRSLSRYCCCCCYCLRVWHSRRHRRHRRHRRRQSVTPAVLFARAQHCVFKLL